MFSHKKCLVTKNTKNLYIYTYIFIFLDLFIYLFYYQHTPREDCWNKIFIYNMLLVKVSFISLLCLKTCWTQQVLKTSRNLLFMSIIENNLKYLNLKKNKSDHCYIVFFARVVWDFPFCGDLVWWMLIAIMMHVLAWLPSNCQGGYS